MECLLVAPKAGVKIVYDKNYPPTTADYLIAISRGEPILLDAQRPPTARADAGPTGGWPCPTRFERVTFAFGGQGLLERRAPPQNLRRSVGDASLVSVQRVFLRYGRRILDQSFASLNALQNSCYFEINGSNDQFDGASSSSRPTESSCNVHEQGDAQGYQPRIFDSQHSSGLDV
jgi:hypothetical protein